MLHTTIQRTFQSTDTWFELSHLLARRWETNHEEVSNSLLWNHENFQTMKRGQIENECGTFDVCKFENSKTMNFVKVGMNISEFVQKHKQNFLQTKYLCLNFQIARVLLVKKFILTGIYLLIYEYIFKYSYVLLRKRE